MFSLHFLVNLCLGQNVWTFFATASPPPAPDSVTSEAPIKAVRAALGHAGWFLSDALDVSVRVRGPAEKRDIWDQTG